MTADKISTTVDSLQHAGWRFRRKAVVLVALCCVGLLAYSLNCFGSSKGGARALATSNEATRHRASHNSVTVKKGAGAQKVGTGDAGDQDSTFALISKLQKPLDPAVERGTDDVSFSSSDESEYEEDSDTLPESVPLRPQGAWQRRLPQAIIIGIKKGGTRALLEFLRVHPQVAVSGKEVHFFDRHYDRGMDWYRKAMPFSYENQLTMEKTPGYFVTPEVPRRIYRMSHNVKFLVVMRNPIARAISDHAQSLSKGKTTPFEDKAMLSRAKCRVDDEWSAIRIGLYAEHLSNWLKYFPIDQFLFINGENLVANPGQEMEKVQDFLGIRRVITKDSFFINQDKGFPCLKATGDRDVKCLGETKGRTHQPVDPKVMQCLAEFYRPNNERFYKMTGINFHWEDQGG